MRSSILKVFAQQQPPASVLLLGLFLGSLTVFTQACSPPMGDPPPDTIERRVHFADAVVHGKVLRHFYPTLPSPFRQFTAEMEIFCVYKGDQLPTFINITNAGFLGGLCFSTKLDVNGTYLVFLRKSGRFNQDLEPTDNDIAVTGFNDPKLQNLTRICDLVIRPPVGIPTEPRNYECPAALNGPDCVRFGTPPPPVIFPTIDPVGPPLKDFTTPEPKVVNDDAQGRTADNNTQQQQNNTTIKQLPSSAEASTARMFGILGVFGFAWMCLTARL